jgi:hypothetical protein
MYFVILICRNFELFACMSTTITRVWFQHKSIMITTKLVSSNPADGEVYSIQHYVIKFVSRQTGGYMHVQLKIPYVGQWKRVRSVRAGPTSVYIINEGLFVNTRSIRDWLCSVKLVTSFISWWKIMQYHDVFNFTTLGE